MTTIYSKNLAPNKKLIGDNDKIPLKKYHKAKKSRILFTLKLPCLYKKNAMMIETKSEDFKPEAAADKAENS